MSTCSDNEFSDAKKPAVVLQDTEEFKDLKTKVTLYEEAIKQLQDVRTLFVQL